MHRNISASLDHGISARDISEHMKRPALRAHCPYMTNEQFRELCEKVLVPLIVAAIEPHLVDIHDILDISANELMRIGDRLDDIDTRLYRVNDE
jgi:hypothetical protein